MRTAPEPSAVGKSVLFQVLVACFKPFKTACPSSSAEVTPLIPTTKALWCNTVLLFAKFWAFVAASNETGILEYGAVVKSVPVPAVWVASKTIETKVPLAFTMPVKVGSFICFLVISTLPRVLFSKSPDCKIVKPCPWNAFSNVIEESEACALVKAVAKSISAATCVSLTFAFVPIWLASANPVAVGSVLKLSTTLLFVPGAKVTTPILGSLKALLVATCVPRGRALNSLNVYAL